MAQLDAPTRAPSRRTIALVLLVVQNASVSLLTRLSRTTTSSTSSTLYNPAVAVFTAELVKFAVSLSMLARQRTILLKGKEEKKGRGGGGGLLGQAVAALNDLRRNQKQECFKLAIPAALYALQNTLLYTALSNLDAATYQTTYQLKLLTTALFSILFFRRHLSLLKWFSLFLLTLGVAIVQLESVDPSSSSSSAKPPSTSTSLHQDPRKGFAAILAACVSSGLAGGWFEYVLKAPSSSPSPAPVPPTPAPSPKTDSDPCPASPTTPTSPKLQLRPDSPSLWARNLQLSVPSLLFSFTGVFLSHPFRLAWEKRGLDGVIQALGGMWEGFSPLVWGVVANQAVGGLLVAMVVREADSVAKGFATSLAIVLSTLTSALLFHTIPGTLFILGASLVIGSTVLYSIETK
ncbi:hypothetical protein JCM11251_005833 [Rhodosporidiobolus azoricus]